MYLQHAIVNLIKPDEQLENADLSIRLFISSSNIYIVKSRQHSSNFSSGKHVFKTFSFLISKELEGRAEGQSFWEK